MLLALKKILSVEELKKKIVFTLILLLVCRVGAYIPVPGIDGEVAGQLFKAATGGSQNLFQLMDMFSGGAFAQMTIVALGVMPYISSTIILQLFVTLIPSFQREIKENYEAGKKKLGKWTRLLTVGLAFFQSCLFAKYALQLAAGAPNLIVPELLTSKIFGVPWLFFLLVMCTMTSGTILLMWLGEQITEKGIGNGISLIITMGILSSLPTTIGSMIQQLNLDSQEPGRLNFTTLVVLAVVFVFIIIGTILIIQGQRKIPLQYARRNMSVEEGQNPNAHIPLKINYAGVIPVIFASALLMFPATIGQFAGQGKWLGQFAYWLSPGQWPYMVCYVMLIVFFTYFWTATQFHPEQIASDMKKSGAFIPGVRQGRPTQEYLENTMNKITFAGAIFLAGIAILPTLVGKILNVDASITYFFGGTSLLILVGVVLDTTKQIESHLLMKKYDGFIKYGRLRGR
jgi:preprotein translocase subunit SecY